MTEPKQATQHEPRSDYEPGPPRRGPVGAQTARPELSESFHPEQLPVPPEPQTGAGKVRVQHKTQSLTPEQAAAIIVRVREKHGLGEKYARTVWLGGNGKWSIVAPDGDSTTVDPMSERQLREWLEKVYFIEAITEHDATTEG